MSEPKPTASPLARTVGVPGAVLMGLGSILGTGIFVSIGLAAEVAGPSVILAVVIAGLVATFNALSSAQLAASYPVSGGTYEYGYRLLSPQLGFTAGWMFLLAKSASAATAALGVAGYALVAFDVSSRPWQITIALVLVIGLTVVVAGGINRSNRVNAVMVSFTLVTLLVFVGFGFPTARAGSGSHLTPFFAANDGGRHLLHASALMFVAFTGYGRIATLGEEIREPSRNIPRAIIITLVSSALLYIAVAWIGVASVGASGLAAATRQAAAPLELVARGFHSPKIAWIVAAGAGTAMLGVLLNLLLGLSRVVLAMARRGDLPSSLAVVDHDRSSPRAAVFFVGMVIAALTSLGSIRTTWSFSAFTVLIYYAITNLAALRLAPERRRYPRWVSAAGLICCVGLAFWVDSSIWGVGVALILIGLVWHRIRPSID